MEGLSSVYYLGEDGKRYVFPTEDNYFSWYSDFSGVVTIPQSELESYPLGSNITIRPGTHLVKITTDPKVYAVEEGGVLRPIPDEDTAETLYGENWADRVVDVPDAFFVNYTIEDEELSADTYPQGTLVQPADSNDIYYINAEGEAQLIEDEAAFEANRFGWNFIVQADEDYELPTVGDEITGAVNSLIDPSQGTSGDTSEDDDDDEDAGTGLSVALSDDTPASASLPKNVVPAFATYNFTASNDGAVEVERLELKRIGVGDKDNVGDVYLYNGNTKLTNARTISASDGTVTFNRVNLDIPAGETKSITVRAAVDTDGGNHGFAIEEANDIETNGATVSGSFPIQGNIMSFANVEGGSMTYDYGSVARSTLKVGDTEEEVAELDLTAAGEDVELNQVTLTNEGSADANDLKNFKLYEGSTLLGEVESSDSDAVTIVLDEALVIEENDSETITLKADIMGGIDTDSIQYEVDDATDIQATGVEYGYLVDVDAGGGSSTPITVEAGELTLEIDGPSSQEVTKKAEDVNMANLMATVEGNDPIEVDEFNGTIELATSSSEDVDDDIENVQLVNVDTGDVYDVTLKEDDSDEFYEFKVENFTIEPGETNWRIELDFVEDNVDAGDSYRFSMEANTTGVKAENIDGETIDDIKPGSTIEGNDVTIEDASLSVSAGNLSDGDAVARSEGVKLVKFTVDAGDAEDIKVTEVNLEAADSSQDLTASTSNYTLVEGEDNELETGVSASSPSTGGADTVSFSDINDGNGLVVSAGETVTLYVKADITSGANSGNLQLSLTGITAETDEDGDDVTVTGDSFDGRTVSIRDKGTLTLSEDNSSIDNNHIWLSSSSDNEALKIKAEAEYEDLKITELKLNNFGAGTSSIAAIHLYQDGELIDTVNNVSGSVATFDNLDLVIDDAEDSVLSVEVDVAGIGSDAEDTAASADEISFDVATTTYEGVSSLNEKDDYVPTVSSNTYTVYASKVTAVESENQPSVLADGTKEALKFTLTPDTNDGKTAQLHTVDVDYNISGSASTTEAYLYSGSNVLASTTIPSDNGQSGTVILDLSTESTGVDNISDSGETYTVKFDVTGSDADDKLTASVDVNGGADNDDIHWNDYDEGTPDIQWIDLGEDSDVTSIENTINY
jgi:hypothetical protein